MQKNPTPFQKFIRTESVGGMIMPVAIFLLMNRNPEAGRGWGIPIATDIAFSLAILKLLGKRVPLILRYSGNKQTVQ